jgi:hypothetical protein
MEKRSSLFCSNMQETEKGFVAFMPGLTFFHRKVFRKNIQNKKFFSEILNLGKSWTNSAKPNKS